MTMPCSASSGAQFAPALLLVARERRDLDPDLARAARPASGRPANDATTLACTCPRRPATRTMKNSSRLLAEIDRKRSCSSSGWLRFDASSMTRRLKRSQDNSRLTKRSGDWESPIGRGAVAAFPATSIGCTRLSALSSERMRSSDFAAVTVFASLLLPDLRSAFCLYGSR